MEESSLKMFQPLTDLTKYIKIINTTERILYECPLFSKIGENETNSKIKFLKLYETFMLLSTVILFYVQFFFLIEKSFQCKSFVHFKFANYNFNISVNFKYETTETSTITNTIKSLEFVSQGQTLEFYSNNHLDMLNVHRVLKTKLNLLGFHENFKAIKKIGRGNFAIVKILKSPIHSLFQGLHG